MKKKPVWLLAVIGSGLAFSWATVDAGLFSKKSASEACESCEEDESKKKSKCCCFFDLADPPRAGTASAVPAVITNQRATRQPAPAAAAAPAPVPAAANTCAPGGNVAADSRMDLLQRDVTVLKEQIRVLSTLLQQAHAPPAPMGPETSSSPVPAAPAPAPPAEAPAP